MNEINNTEEVTSTSEDQQPKELPTTKPSRLAFLKTKKGMIVCAGIVFLLLIMGFVIMKITSSDKKPVSNSNKSQNQSANATNLGDPNSTDPLTKGLALSNGQCSGKGPVKLTHSPMDTKDVETIQPMGAMIGGHVTPIDHEYYYQKNQLAPKDTYPVYATADGAITEVSDINDGTKQAWAIIIAHTCTFFTWYNLMTSITPEIRNQLPAGWGPGSNGGVKIPVKSGQIIGYVGGQSLDVGIWNTEKFLKGLLNPIAYNNSEPWKIVTVPALDYYTSAVKADVLQRYVRTVEPRDGKIDYDIKGKAAGTWFLVGTNGYAGTTNNDGKGAAYASHLSLAYDSVDPKALTFSIGDYQGQPTQFSVKGSVDWTKINKTSGITKVELAQRQWVTGTGEQWRGQYATGIKLLAGPSQATVLIQMTADDMMKIEVFPGKTPAQVPDFTPAAKTYDRGQNSQMIKSTTAT